MITGQVNADYEMVIPVDILTVNGSFQQLQAVIDTGFTGYLTLPREDVSNLQLQFLHQRQFSLAGDVKIDLDVYLARISWNGQDRDIHVICAEGDRLLGMSLLKGSRLEVDILDGATVLIVPIRQSTV